MTGYDVRTLTLFSTNRCTELEIYLIITLLKKPVTRVEEIQLRRTSRITGVKLLICNGEKITSITVKIRILSPPAVKVSGEFTSAVI